MYDSDEDNKRMQDNVSPRCCTNSLLPLTRRQQYQRLIEILNEKREEAIVSFNAGNRAKGYVIFKILSEEATKVRLRCIVGLN